MLKHTPWGPTQDTVTLAEGIVSYETASHGGIWLSKERQRELGLHRNFLQTQTWWEEDCDWAIPYAHFAAAILEHGTAYKFEQNLQLAMQITKREVTT